MPHEVGVFGDTGAVDAELTLVFENIRFYGYFAVTVFRFGCDVGLFRAHFHKLFIVADTERRARAKVKNGFCAVGFPLRVFAEKHVQSVGKHKRFPLVISEILKE